MDLPDPDEFFRESVAPHYLRVFGYIPKPDPLPPIEEEE